MAQTLLRKDCKVFRIESRMKRSDASGTGWGEWEDAFPGKRYSLDEVFAFEADLTFDDCFGIQWRGRMVEEWGGDSYRLTPRSEKGERRAVTRRAAHDGDLPAYCVTPWSAMLAQMGVAA